MIQHEQHVNTPDKNNTGFFLIDIHNCCADLTLIRSLQTEREQRIGRPAKQAQAKPRPPSEAQTITGRMSRAFKYYTHQSTRRSAGALLEHAVFPFNEQGAGGGEKRLDSQAWFSITTSFEAPFAPKVARTRGLFETLVGALERNFIFFCSLRARQRLVSKTRKISSVFLCLVG